MNLHLVDVDADDMAREMALAYGKWKERGS